MQKIFRQKIKLKLQIHALTLSRKKKDENLSIYKISYSMYKKILSQKLSVYLHCDKVTPPCFYAKNIVWYASCFLLIAKHNAQNKFIEINYTLNYEILSYTISFNWGVASVLRRRILV